jgi:putative addiction module component (TIGR02574 family)
VLEKAVLLGVAGGGRLVGMSSVNMQRILKLSLAERIQLVEDIWDSIAESPEALPLTAAQEAELDRRLADHEANPESGRSWEEVRASLDKDT